MLLVTGVLVAFFEVLGAAVLFHRDHQLAFRPRWWAIRDSVLHGELPALTAGGHGGVPIEQIMNGTYTPGALAIFAGPFGYAYDLLVAVHYVLLAAGAWALARRLGATHASAVIVGAVAALAGPVISTESLGVVHIGLAYTPWVLLAWHRLLSSPDARGAAWLALAIGCQVQAIIPSVLLIDLLGALLLYGAARPAEGARVVVFAGLGALLGLAVGAVGLLPALEGLSGSQRSAGFGYGATSGWAVSPAMFVEYVTPVFWSPPDVPFLNPGGVTGNQTDPAYFPSLYFGTAIPLAVIGAMHRRRWPLVALLVFFAIVAMGRHTPLHQLVASLPLLSSSRYAVKYTLLVTAAITVLSCSGLHALPSRARAARNVAIAYAAVVLAVAIGTQTQAFTERLVELHRFGSTRWGLADSVTEVAAIAQGYASAHAWHAFVFAAALAIVLALWARYGGDRWAGAVAGIVLVDLVVAATYVVVPIDPEVGRLPDAIVEPLTARPPPPYFVASPTSPVRLDLSRGDYANEVTRYFARNGMLEVPGARRFEDLELEGQSNPFHVAVSRLAARATGDVQRRILVRAGVRRILVPREQLEAEPIDGNDYVHAYGRFVAFDLSTWREPEIARFLANPAMLDVALVERGPQSQTSTTACASPPRVAWTSAGPNGPIDADVTSDCEAAVVLHEVAKRGWAVLVDDEEAEIFAMDAGYVGVFVPPGEHRVRFEYRSLAVQWASMSLVALVLAVWLILRRRAA